MYHHYGITALSCLSINCDSKVVTQQLDWQSYSCSFCYSIVIYSLTVIHFCRHPWTHLLLEDDCHWIVDYFSRTLERRKQCWLDRHRPQGTRDPFHPRVWTDHWIEPDARKGSWGENEGSRERSLGSDPDTRGPRLQTKDGWSSVHDFRKKSETPCLSNEKKEKLDKCLKEPSKKLTKFGGKYTFVVDSLLCICEGIVNVLRSRKFCSFSSLIDP
jgi:hypothetical protein